MTEKQEIDPSADKLHEALEAMRRELKRRMGDAAESPIVPAAPRGLNPEGVWPRR